MNKRQGGNVTLIIVVIFVALAVIVAGLFVWSRRGDNNIVQKAKETTSVKTETAKKAKEGVEVITVVSLLLQHVGDESLLPSETPASFVEYMKSRLNYFDCDFVESPSAGFMISKISPRFVAGNISCMGGAATVWYLTTTGWEELGYQSQVPCSKLVELAIPSEFISECYDDASPGEEVITNPNSPLN